MDDKFAMALVSIALGVLLAIAINMWTTASIQHGNQMCQQTPECAQRINQ